MTLHPSSFLFPLSSFLIPLHPSSFFFPPSSFLFRYSSCLFPLSSFPLPPFPHVPFPFPPPPLKTALRCEPDPRVYRVTGAHEHRVNGLYLKKGNHSKWGMWVKVDPLTVAKEKERAKAKERSLKKAKKKKKKKRKKKRRREEDEPVEAVEGGASNMEVGGEEGEGGSAEEGDVEDGSAAEEKESDELAELAAHTMMALVRCQMNRGSHQWFLSLSDTRSPGTDKVRGGGSGETWDAVR